MIDRALIDKLPSGQKEPVVIAIMTLASSGIILRQIAANKAQLLEGFDSDAHELAKRIIDAQQVNRVLLGIHELGAQYVKEHSSESADQ